METRCEGLIVRETVYGDNDLIVSVLTAEHGKISVRCHGVRSLRSPWRNIIHCLFFNSFVIYESRGHYSLKEAGCIRSFYDINMSIETLTLAQYVLEVANDIAVEGQEQTELLRLCLNTLHALTETEKNPQQVKTVFELRAMAVAGFLPDLCGCCSCGKLEFPLFFDIAEGNLVCARCLDEEYRDAPITLAQSGRKLISVSMEMLEALLFIFSAPPQKILSFSAEKEVLKDLERLSEAYLTYRLERTFSTLQFYKQLTKFDEVTN